MTPVQALEFIVGFDDVDDLIVDIAAKAIAESKKNPAPVTLGETAALEYAGKLRDSLCKLAGYAATAQSENTRDWMEGLVEYLNEAAVVANADTVFVLHRSIADGAMWITARDLSCSEE